MPLIYITGVSGTGKSTIMQVLRARGYEAHGVDEEKYADWVNRATGKLDAFPRRNKRIDLHRWYEKHHEVLDARNISQLQRSAKTQHKLIFLCGSARGERKLWHYFDVTIVLLADARTLKHRIAKRSNSVFGKTSQELAGILRWRARNNARYYCRLGAATVGATKPVDKVVDDILAIVQARTTRSA